MINLRFWPNIIFVMMTSQFSIGICSIQALKEKPPINESPASSSIPHYYQQSLEGIRTLSTPQRRVKAYTSLINNISCNSVLPLDTCLQLFGLIEQDLLLCVSDNLINLNNIGHLYRSLQKARYDVTKKQKRLFIARSYKKWLLGVAAIGIIAGLGIWLKRERDNQKQYEAEEARKFEMLKNFVSDRDRKEPFEGVEFQIDESRFSEKDVKAIEDDLGVNGDYCLVIVNDTPSNSMHKKPKKTQNQAPVFAEVRGLDDDFDDDHKKEDEEVEEASDQTLLGNMRTKGKTLYIPQSWVKDYRTIGTDYFSNLITSRVGQDGKKNRKIRLSKLIMNKTMFKNFGYYIRNTVKAHKMYGEKDLTKLHIGRSGNNLILQTLGHEAQEMDEIELVRMILVAQEFSLIELFCFIRDIYYKKYPVSFDPIYLGEKRIIKHGLLSHCIRKKIVDGEDLLCLHEEHKWKSWASYVEEQRRASEPRDISKFLKEAVAFIERMNRNQ